MLIPLTLSLSTGDNAATSEGGAVCALLTAQEASDILGFKVAEGTEAVTSCTYNPEPPSMTGLGITRMDNQGSFDMMTKNWEPVSGLGDRAAFREGGMVVQKGGKGVSISIINPKQGMSTKEPLTKIAEKIASRL